MTQEKIFDRIRKLLALAGATSEAEAALAAQRAAELMAAHEITEAEIRVLDSTSKPELIIRDHLHETATRRVAWRGAVASGVTRSMGCRMWWQGGSIRLFGRASAVQAASYTARYLCAEVDRLCEAAWDAAPHDGASARAWKSAFRVGAASRLAARLVTTQEAAAAARREQARAAVVAANLDGVAATRTTALVKVEHEAKEVVDEFAAYTGRGRGFRNSNPARAGYRSASGWSAGVRAADGIAIGIKRAGLNAPPRKLGGG